MQVEKAAFRLALAATLCAACAVVSLGAQSSAGAGTYTPPRTAWGDPDLQGIWPSTDMVGVPFERPENMGERTEVTAEEFATRQKQEQTRSAADLEQGVSTAARQGDGTGPPSHWLEWARR